MERYNRVSTMDIVESVLNTVGSKYGAKYIPLVRKWLEKYLPVVIRKRLKGVSR